MKLPPPSPEVLQYFPRLADPDFFEMFSNVAPIVGLALLASFLLLLRAIYIHRRERKFDRILQEKLAQREAEQTPSADVDMDDPDAALALLREPLPVESEELSGPIPPEDVASAAPVSTSSPIAKTPVTIVPESRFVATWEDPALSAAEQDHMRERCAHHAREWLSRELAAGELHPVAQAHVYNLLYSLKNAEGQIAALREEQNSTPPALPPIDDGREKPRYKLVLPKKDI